MMTNADGGGLDGTHSPTTEVHGEVGSGSTTSLSGVEAVAPPAAPAAGPTTPAGPSSPAPADAASSSRTLLSLNDCADRLAAPSDLGARAPAHVTLKRWSGKGWLDEAVVLEGGRKRKLYVLEIVRKVCLAKMAGRFWSASGDEKDSSGGSAGDDRDRAAREAARPNDLGDEHGQVALGGATSADFAIWDSRLAAVERQVQALGESQAAALSGLASQVARVAGYIENLEAVRKQLMARTDGELTAVRQQLASAQAELARAQASTIESGRISQAAAKIQDAASRIESAMLPPIAESRPRGPHG